MLVCIKLVLYLTNTNHCTLVSTALNIVQSLIITVKLVEEHSLSAKLFYLISNVSLGDTIRQSVSCKAQVQATQEQKSWWEK